MNNLLNNPAAPADLTEAEAIIILSDLHLADGINPRFNGYSPGETFFHDDAFARFLGYLREQASVGKQRWRLLLLGDTLDFLHVRSQRTADYHLDATITSARRKLVAIASGHSSFFAALGEFAAAGFPIHIAPGNHDIELMHPALQSDFVQVLNKAHASSSAEAQIQFFPWIYYIPGLLYAEHGQQYHDINAFVRLLHPYAAQNPEHIDHPIGAYLDEYLFNRRSLSPHYPALSPVHHLHFLRTISLILLRHIGLFQAAIRADYHRTVLPHYPINAGLSTEILTAIDQLAATDSLSILWRIIRRTLLRKQDTGVHVHIYETARRIHDLLNTSGKAVPFYVFGHTHKPEFLPFTTGTTSPAYLNSGTWTDLRQSGTAQPARLTYIEISRSRHNNQPQARLMHWDNQRQIAQQYHP